MRKNEEVRREEEEEEEALEKFESKRSAAKKVFISRSSRNSIVRDSRYYRPPRYTSPFFTCALPSCTRWPGKKSPGDFKGESFVFSMLRGKFFSSPIREKANDQSDDRWKPAYESNEGRESDDLFFFDSMLDANDELSLRTKLRSIKDRVDKDKDIP